MPTDAGAWQELLSSSGNHHVPEPTHSRRNARERGARALEERLGLKSTIEVKEQESATPGDIETGDAETS